jgi:sugar phosphate permease
MWYRRHECGFRMALFFSAATAAGAFGGLLARGISEMGGVGGKAAWSWIFILEGLLTLTVGSFSYWVINDYPST